MSHFSTFISPDFSVLLFLGIPFMFKEVFKYLIYLDI